MQTTALKLEESQDIERSWYTAHADLREVIERVAKFLPSHLELPVYIHKKQELFAWRRPIPLAEGWARYRLYFFGIHLYNTFTYRLSIYACDRNSLPKKLTDRTFGTHAKVELSFVSTDLDQVISPDLPKFVESIFDSGSGLEDAHPWPLFASDRNFPEYAWSIAGEAARLSQLWP